jgi:hypothetical protein
LERPVVEGGHQRQWNVVSLINYGMAEDASIAYVEFYLML